MQIVESDALFNFTNSLPNAQTRQKYQEHLKRFLNGKTIVDFLNSTDMEKQIIKYLVEMRQRNLSHSYIYLAFAAIKHLCFMNDVVINTKKIGKFVGEKTELKHDRPYNHDEILKLLNIADLRMKVIVLLLASTGMRIGALPTLTLGSVDGVRVTVYAETPDKYITFITPECKNAIDNYIEFRKRSGEKITPESYLLREKFDMNDIEQVRKRAKQVTKSGITHELTRLLVKSGIRITDRTSPHGQARHDVKLANGFRKFFTNALIEADLKTEHRWLLEGHHLKANDDYYVRTSEKILYEAYQKAENLLTIDPTKRLQRKVEILQIEKSKVDELWSEMQAMKQKMGL